MYLSYLMGVKDATENHLKSLGVANATKSESGNWKLEIPTEKIEAYKEFVKAKLEPGFWNEFLDEYGIHFIFKLKDGTYKEYALSSTNEQEIDNLCAKLNNEPPEKTANVYKYLAENDYYHDFMWEHYQPMIERMV